MTATALPPRARGTAVLALLLFAAHMALANRYGVFRDELYYVACGKHLAFGYVDHPPLVAWMARSETALFGNSVIGLRVWPALLAAVAVWLSAELARVMGGANYAQILAALCVATAPELLGTDHFLSMNCVLPVAWTAAALFAIRGWTEKNTRAWVGFGVACGIGLLAKHSTLFFGAAMALGMLVSSSRKQLLTRGPWIGAAVAAVVFAPNMIWEIAQGFPTLEFMHNAQAKKMVAMSVPAFMNGLFMTMGPPSAIVWGAGCIWMLFTKSGARFRFLGVTFIAVIGIVALAHGKPYYVAGAFPLAYAAGGVYLEQLVKRIYFRIPIIALLAIPGVAVAPLALPILEPETFRRYEGALGLRGEDSEKHEKGLLPQHFADQFGWRPMAERVATAYHQLTPEEQRVTAIYGGNYGEAGTVDFFGPELGLPTAVSGHNSYYLWGPPRDGRGEILLAIGPDKSDLEELYFDVTAVGETDEKYAMPYEDHVPLYLCRRPKVDIRVVWNTLKIFI